MRSVAVLVNAALLWVPSLAVPTLAQTAQFAEPVALDIAVLDDLSWRSFAVCAADLDGDGDRDLLLGRQELHRYINDGTDAEPRLRAAEMVSTSRGPIKVEPG